MTLTLANLLTEENEGIRDAARYFNTSGYAAPYVALVLVGLIVFLGCAYLLWCHRRRQMQQPGSRALLRLLGDEVGVTADHRRLLWNLGRAVDIEPAAALVSPVMLTEMVDRIRRRGEKLSAEDAAHMTEILDIVTAAGGKP